MKEVIDVSEPEAKQNVLDGIERCREALFSLESADNSDLGGCKKGIEEAVELLESLKEKVFLKTKKALTPAYLVLESSQNVAEFSDDVSGGDDDAADELKDAVSQLKDNVAKLQGASKQHSVIVT
jgi:hypothetical protein